VGRPSSDQTPAEQRVTGARQPGGGFPHGSRGQQDIGVAELCRHALLRVVTQSPCRVVVVDRGVQAGVQQVEQLRGQRVPVLMFPMHASSNVRDREDATCVGCLRLILIEGAATNIDACRANPQGSLFEVDVRPALPSDLAAP
jgi:hypothetical protein